MRGSEVGKRRVGVARLPASVAAAALSVAVPGHLLGEPAPAGARFYVGTYTGGASRGIYACRLDRQTGAMSMDGLAAAAENPSWLALAPGGGVLYAVHEVSSHEGAPTGLVSAYRVEGGGATLTLLNSVASGGGAPCHLSVDPSGRWVLAANYGGGSVATFPAGADGRLGAKRGFVQHAGASVDPRRQAGPHAHCVVPDLAGRFALVADLGLDKVLVYRLDPATGGLEPCAPCVFEARPGAGPRHIAVHPGGRWVYVINELDSTVAPLVLDPQTGALRQAGSVSALPAGFTGANTTAEIAVHPTGRYVYGSNRGHDSIAIFAVDAATGALRLVGHVSTQGRTPRNFAIDPTGAFLLAANQDSGTIVAFRLDAATGGLAPVAAPPLSVDRPVCVLFAVDRTDRSDPSDLSDRSDGAP